MSFRPRIKIGNVSAELRVPKNPELVPRGYVNNLSQDSLRHIRLEFNVYYNVSIRKSLFPTRRWIKYLKKVKVFASGHGQIVRVNQPKNQSKS